LSDIINIKFLFYISDKSGFELTFTGQFVGVLVYEVLPDIDLDWFEKLYKFLRLIRY